MKKICLSIAFVLITLFVIGVLTSCSKSAKAGKVISGSVIQAVYYPFEEIMKSANDAVLAKCIKIHDYPDGFGEIEFEVEKRYFGEDTKTIFVLWYDTHYVSNDYSYDSSIIKYEEGKNYFLILSRTHTPVMDHDAYSFVVDFIPVEGISEKSLYLGKTPDDSEDELFRELTRSAEDMDAYLSGYDASENLLYKGRKYIETDNEEEIIKGSDYVLTVRVGAKDFDGIILNHDIYTCTVLKVMKGQCEPELELMIIFPKNRVKPGEEYTVGLHLPYFELDAEKPEPADYQNPKLLIPSSKKVFLSMTEEEILAVLKS